MFSLLLKKALPFTLTLAAGVALGGLSGLAGGAKRAETTPVTRTYELGGRCRMRARHLVAETRPLVILLKPDARWPGGAMPTAGGAPYARVNVTFGADGKVAEVAPAEGWFVNWESSPTRPVWLAVERAARQIEFTPEVVNSVPVTVTREVEIRFMGD